MKTTSIYIILLGCIGYCTAFNSFASFDTASSIFNQMNRMKRDPSNEQFNCVSACFNAVESFIKNETESIDALAKEPVGPDGPISLGQFVCYMHNPIWLKPSCSVYEKFRECTTKCPDDMTKNLTLQLVEPFEFICTDRIEDVKYYLPCIFDTCNKSHANCDRKCQHYKERLEHMPNENHNATHREKILEIEKQLTHVCNYAGCSLTCMYSKIKRECGSGGAYLEREFIEEIFISIQEFFSHAQGFKWPKACEKFTDN